MQLFKTLKESYSISKKALCNYFASNRDNLEQTGRQFRIYLKKPFVKGGLSVNVWSVLIPFILLIGSLLWCVKVLQSNHVFPSHANYVAPVPPADEWGNDLTTVVATDLEHEAEALQWIKLLYSYHDELLEPDQLAKKYLNLTIASTILSGSGKGKFRQRFWSDKAIEYGKLSLGLYATTVPGHSNDEIDEVHTRLLVAMSLNYYQEGKIKKEDLINQFGKIDKSYLVRSGFCSNRLLRLLEDDKILQLPNYFSEIYI